MLLNAIRGIMGVLFPLISFPYISRVLGAEELGKYNYASSIVSYFVLFSALGIDTYAIRRISAVKDNKDELNQFVAEIFSLNIITTLISYIALALILIICSNIFSKYYVLIAIVSISIIMQTLSMNWLYQALEKFLFITVRIILFNLISLVMMFVLVNNSSDVNIYAFVALLSTAGSGVVNFIYAHKICRIKFKLKINWKEHLRPILIFFATTISVTIYVSSDITILGLICSDYEVGLYSVSVKIYTVLKTLLASIIIATVPTISYLIAKRDEEGYKKVANESYSMIITLVLPLVTGICFFAEKIILFIAGEEYIPAAMSLRLLSICILCYMFAYFWGQCVLVPFHREKIVLWATIISALINIILNIILIPFFKQDAAAFTSILGEGVVMIISMLYGRKYIRIDSMKTTSKVLIGCLGIIASCMICNKLFNGKNVGFILAIVLSMIVYFFVETILKNDSIYSIITAIEKKFRFKNKTRTNS